MMASATGLSTVQFVLLGRQHLLNSLLLLEQHEPEPPGFARLEVLHDDGVCDFTEGTEVLLHVGAGCVSGKSPDKQLQFVVSGRLDQISLLDLLWWVPFSVRLRLNPFCGLLFSCLL